MARRRSLFRTMPPYLVVFDAAGWPQPVEGDDPGHKGLREYAGTCEEWLVRLAADYPGDPGLVDAWRLTFAYKRWADARLAWVEEYHPSQHTSEWIDLVGSELMIVHEYVMARDAARRESREW
jgi:hypothetical protein